MIKKILIAAFCIFIFYATSVFSKENENQSENQWITIPAGAKQAYMGIHGGTMPVSLLVGMDGASLLSFVGLTGNDFLGTLRKGNFPLPSFTNATSMKVKNNTVLYAGNTFKSLPVYQSDFTGQENEIKQLVPFGFSPFPLEIEGYPKLPHSTSAIRKYRKFYLPGSLVLQKK